MVGDVAHRVGEAAASDGKGDVCPALDAEELGERKGDDGARHGHKDEADGHDPELAELLGRKREGDFREEQGLFSHQRLFLLLNERYWPE